MLLPVFLWAGNLIQSETHNPARQSEEAIRAEVLAETPLRTNRKQVQQYISKRWGNEGMAFSEDDAETGKTRRGVYWQYGRYIDFRDPFHQINVVVKWYFDDRDRLDDIAVAKRAGGA